MIFVDDAALRGHRRRRTTGKRNQKHAWLPPAFAAANGEILAVARPILYPHVIVGGFVDRPLGTAVDRSRGDS